MVSAFTPFLVPLSKRAQVVLTPQVNLPLYSRRVGQGRKVCAVSPLIPASWMCSECASREAAQKSQKKELRKRGGNHNKTSWFPFSALCTCSERRGGPGNWTYMLALPDGQETPHPATKSTSSFPWARATVRAGHTPRVLPPLSLRMTSPPLCPTLLFQFSVLFERRGNWTGKMGGTPVSCTFSVKYRRIHLRSRIHI